MKWDLSEPNLESAAEKNAKGVCAMHECQNALGEPPAYGYLGSKVCDEHGQHFDKFREEIVKDVLKESDKWVIKRISNRR